MYKVMLVEDEPPIMRMIKATIESADSDFVVTKSCINGKSAIETLEKEDFDVILTDIKMPIMSGIELAKWVKANKSDTLVVLLSGYRDFEYARQALEYKVFDYLLKPVSRDKVKELTIRIKQELKKITKPEPSHDEEKSTVVILACAGAYLLYGSNVTLPGERFWTDDKISDFMDTTLHDNEEYVFFNTNVQAERFVVVGTDDSSRQELIVKSLFENLTDDALPVTLLYKTNIKFKDAGKCFASLREQLINKLILDSSQLICCNTNADGFEGITNLYSKEDVESITLAIRCGNVEKTRERLKTVLFRMHDNHSTQSEVINMLNVVIDTYTLNYPDKLKRKNSSVKNEVITAVAGFTTYNALIEDITSIFITMRREETDRYEQLAEDIEKYIKQNYTKTITSETLSHEFGFVPSYISRIFKQKKNISPSEYITKYRIKLAKKLMTENPDIMIKEVANRTGFKEAYYFSKTFKRETGLWPTEFMGKADFKRT